MIMRLDTRFLSEIPVITAVVEAGTFGRAGKILGLSQSAVSRAVQRLERHLGTRLLDRNTKTVRLTESGKRFCEEVVPLLGRLAEAASATTKGATAVRGRLRVNVDPTFARLLLMPRLRTFLDTYPELHLELAVREEVGDLVSDGFDAAIRFGIPKLSSLLVRRILEARVLTCAAPAYLRRKGTPKTPQELALRGHDCLLFIDPSSGAPFPWEFHQGRKVLTIQVMGRITMTDPSTYLEACLAGLGVAQLFDLGTEALLASGRIVNLFPKWTDERFPLYVYHPSRNFVPAKLRSFLEFVATIPGI
jgi:DNA-binding transcriptional LysR family regulator